MEKRGGRRPLEEAPVSSSCCVLAPHRPAGHGHRKHPRRGTLFPVNVHVYGDPKGTGSPWLITQQWQTSGSGERLCGEKNSLIPDIFHQGTRVPELPELVSASLSSPSRRASDCYITERDPQGHRQEAGSSLHTRAAQPREPKRARKG